MDIRWVKYAFAASVALLLANPWHQARAAIIVFKDGFMLHGKVREPKEIVFTGEISIARPKGFMYVDDHVRRVVFTPRGSQIIEVIKDDLIQEKDLLKLERTGIKSQGKMILPGWTVQKVSEFDEKWERTITMDNSRGQPVYITQRIVAMTPRYIHIQSLHYNWDLAYKTSEFPPELVRHLLVQHYQKQSKFTEPQKRMEIYKFLFQAGWYEQAEKELKALEYDHPEARSVVVAEKENLKRVRANLLADDIERLHRTGQHRAAQGRIGVFIKNGHEALARDSAPVRELKGLYDTAELKIRQAEEYLKLLPDRVESEAGMVLAKAATELAENLTFDTIERLDAFVTYAEQHVRELKAKKSATQSADQVLAMAITGWLRGNGAAEPDVKLARNLWTVRQMLVEFQQGEDGAKLQNAMEAYCTRKDVKIAPDLVAQLIGSLPPPLADSKVKPGVTTRMGDYFIKLPPEYNPNRLYPVLLVLHPSDEKPEKTMERWSEQAARNGYLLVAPSWGGGKYQYSAREHGLVLDTLRDLRRRFQVDSDRVFLWGRAQGGNMALDVGLSHPDQFAGVLPQNAASRFFPEKYWPNAQYLPFYVVEGDANGLNSKETKEKLLVHWIRFEYPAMYVEYRGRGSEWFASEIATMFDWMNRKRRLNPARELGRLNFGNLANSETFRTMRTTDNRFYWLSTSAIEQRCLNSYKVWDQAAQPASMHGTIRTGNQLDVANPNKGKGGGPIAEKAKIWNHLSLTTTGIRQLTIWLGPNTIDFTKDVVIMHNGRQVGLRHKIEPSIATLLEDFHQNADRQRLVLAKFDLRW